MQDRDYDPDQHPLIAGTPFAGKRPAGMEGMGNFATLDFCWLPSHISDPMERLQASHDSAVEMKEHLKASVDAGADINAVLQICPLWVGTLIRWYIQKNKGKVGFFGNLALSNVPGPREPMYLNRYKLDNWFSIGQVMDGTCLNMTMWSYCDEVNLCILADKQVIPDGWVLYEAFAEELQTLLALVLQRDSAGENQERED